MGPLTINSIISHIDNIFWVTNISHLLTILTIYKMGRVLSRTLQQLGLSTSLVASKTRVEYFPERLKKLGLSTSSSGTTRVYAWLQAPAHRLGGYSHREHWSRTREKILKKPTTSTTTTAKRGNRSKYSLGRVRRESRPEAVLFSMKIRPSESALWGLAPLMTALC